MKFLASQIAALLNGTVEGNPDTEVWNVAKIEEGATGMLSFLANPKYTPYIYETKSSVVIVNKDFVAEKPIETTLIRVDDAYASFAKLLAFYDQVSQDKKAVSSLAFVSSSAKCGGVDYSWGADALSNAHDYTVTMMLYVVYLSYAIAGLVAVIGALQIYIKMQTGEGDITKSIMMLLGACLFMIGAYVLFPAFFGYSII
jgi:hypothetical protein